MSCMERIDKWSDRRKQWTDWIFFSLLLAGYTVLTFTLFHRQTLGNPQHYHSDMKAYILEMQGLESGYPFPYPIFFKLSALVHSFLNNPPLSVAVMTTFLNCLTPVIMKWSMNRILYKRCDKNRVLLGALISVCVFALLFVSMVFPPKGMYLPGILNIYAGVFTPNPLHNATYNATRPFATMVFFLFPVILDEYEEKINWKHNLWFGLFLLLTTMTKPSFTFIMVPAAGLIMLYRLIRSKFRGVKEFFLLGICFIPTFIALLYQFFGVFAPEGDGERGIGFGFAEVWSTYCENIPLAIGLALGFPILVLLLNLGELKKDKWYRFSWQMYLVSLVEILCFFEKGYRKYDLNFSWSYMHGLFYVFVATVMVLIRKTWKKEGKWWLIAAQWLALGWHLLCGIYYFNNIFQGNMYY